MGLRAKTRIFPYSVNMRKQYWPRLWVGGQYLSSPCNNKNETIFWSVILKKQTHFKELTKKVDHGNIVCDLIFPAVLWMIF